MEQSVHSISNVRASAEVQAGFHALADYAVSKLHKDEFITISFDAEDSSFVRVNKAAIRQPGNVRQQTLSCDLIQGARHARGSVSLSGDKNGDKSLIDELLSSLRGQLPHLPEDPHLLYATEVRSTELHGEKRLPEPSETLRFILETGKGKDLVGIWASGGIFSGFANSLGQRNWFSSYTYNFDFSLYHQADKAVKSSYAGFAWDPQEFRRKMDEAAEQLKILTRPPRVLEPGRYRVYLAPSAMNEIMGMLSWGGFSLKAHRTKQTPLLRMVERGMKLHPSVTIRENTRDGVSPNFQASGFVKPDQVIFLEKGAFRDCLASPRSAKEYGVPTNGASDWEFPESIDLGAGTIAAEKILAELGTGLYINNLWYLNYSDRPGCRLTGMTRFACFWVEGGQIVAPLNVMRFDETVYRLLGDNLLGLTAGREMILASDSYGGRSTASARLPGALVEDFTLTL